MDFGVNFFFLRWFYHGLPCIKLYILRCKFFKRFSLIILSCSYHNFLLFFYLYFSIDICWYWFIYLKNLLHVWWKHFWRWRGQLFECFFNIWFWVLGFILVKNNETIYLFLWNWVYVSFYITHNIYKHFLNNFILKFYIWLCLGHYQFLFNVDINYNFKPRHDFIIWRHNIVSYIGWCRWNFSTDLRAKQSR
jgi:hypothetical protein